jgi:uncharacterized protein (DUF2147 family)
MRYPTMLSIALCLVLAIAHASVAKPPGALGRWITETGNYEVDIAPCGAALCGTIVQVLGNRSMSDPTVAVNSPDPRPALGMKILTDLVVGGPGEWTGSVYNRENAKTYSCVVTLLASGDLSVRGYVVLPLFGRTAIWHRP